MASFKAMFDGSCDTSSSEDEGHADEMEKGSEYDDDSILNRIRHKLCPKLETIKSLRFDFTRADGKKKIARVMYKKDKHNDESSDDFSEYSEEEKFDEAKFLKKIRRIPLLSEDGVTFHVKTMEDVEENYIQLKELIEQDDVYGCQLDFEMYEEELEKINLRKIDQEKDMKLLKKSDIKQLTRQPTAEKLQKMKKWKTLSNGERQHFAISAFGNSIVHSNKKIQYLEGKDDSIYPIEADRYNRLRTYQQEAVGHLLKMERVLLSHVMGGGKTNTIITAMTSVIALRTQMKVVTKVLILCPVTNVEGVWQREFDKWGDGLIKLGCKPKFMTTNELSWWTDKDWRKQNQILVIGHERFRHGTNHEIFDNDRPDILIIDEVHKVMATAEKDNQIKQKVEKLTKKTNKEDDIQFVWLASGTPMRNKVSSILNIYQLLGEKFVFDSNEFSALFKPQDQTTAMQRRYYILSQLLSTKHQMTGFPLGRFDFANDYTLKSSGVKLPELYEVFVSLRMSESNHKKMKTTFLNNNSGKTEATTSLAAAEDLVKDEVAFACAQIAFYYTCQKQKTVILVRRLNIIQMIKEIYNRLIRKTNSKMWGECLIIAGNQSVQAKDKSSVLARMESNTENHYLLIGQIDQLAEGVDLTWANNLIMLPIYSMNKMQQALKRIHRPSHKNQPAVNIYHVTVGGSPLKSVDNHVSKAHALFRDVFNTNLSNDEKEDELFKCDYTDVDDVFKLEDPITVDKECFPEIKFPVTFLAKKRVKIEQSNNPPSETQKATNEFFKDLACNLRDNSTISPPYVKIEHTFTPYKWEYCGNSLHIDRKSINTIQSEVNSSIEQEINEQIKSGDSFFIPKTFTGQIPAGFSVNADSRVVVHGPMALIYKPMKTHSAIVKVKYTERLLRQLSEDQYNNSVINVKISEEETSGEKRKRALPNEEHRCKLNKKYTAKVEIPLALISKTIKIECELQIPLQPQSANVTKLLTRLGYTKDKIESIVNANSSNEYITDSLLCIKAPLLNIQPSVLC